MAKVSGKDIQLAQELRECTRNAASADPATANQAVKNLRTLVETHPYNPKAPGPVTRALYDANNIVRQQRGTQVAPDTGVVTKPDACCVSAAVYDHKM